MRTSDRMGTVQDVRIAKRTGFCYGVREAIDKAKESAAAGKLTHTLGQVVHNEGVVRDLTQLGVRSVETLDDVDHGAAVVIRAIWSAQSGWFFLIEATVFLVWGGFGGVPD